MAMSEEFPSNNTDGDFMDYLLSFMNRSGGGGGTNGSAAGGSAEFGPASHYRVPQIMALALSVVSILANLLSLVAVAQVSRTLPTNLRLMVSLCLSDILVSIIIILDTVKMEAFLLIAPSHQNMCLRVTLHALRMTSHIISLLNLFGLALDHYMAFVKPLLYPVIMSPKRARTMIGIFWVLAFLCGFSDFFIPAMYSTYCKSNKTMNVGKCMPAYCTAYDSEYLMFGITLLLCVIMTFIYTRVFGVIWSHRKFINRYQQISTKSRRGLVTTLLILGTFIVCWLPYCTFEIVVLVGTVSSLGTVRKHFPLIMKIDAHLYNLLILNCLFDPVIYATRMTEVKQGYSKVLHSIFKTSKEIHVQASQLHTRLSSDIGTTTSGSRRLSASTSTDVHVV